MMATDQKVATGARTVDPSGPEPPVQDSLTRDQIFHLLQNERRRLALTYLSEREGEVEMRAIAEQVAAWEHDTTVAALDSDQRQRVYIPLYQNHLPKLDEEGVIEYNKSRGIVERTPLADQLDPFLVDVEATHPPSRGFDAPQRTTDRWPRYYLAVAVLSTALIAGAALEVPVLGAISPVAVGLLVVVAFSAVALAQSTRPHLAARE